MRYYTPTTEDGLIRPFIRLLPAADRNTIDAFDFESDKSYYTIYDDEYDKLRAFSPSDLTLMGIPQETIEKIFAHTSSSAAPLPLTPKVLLGSAETAPAQYTALPQLAPSAGQNMEIILKKPLQQESLSAAYAPHRTFKPQITAIGTAEHLATLIPMFVIDQDLYVFNSNCYVKQSQEDAERLIRLLCSDECRAVGKPEFAASVYRSLVQDPVLHIKEEDLQNNFIAFEEGQLLYLTTNEILPSSPSIRTIYSLKCRVPAADLPCPYFSQVMQTITRGDKLLYQRFMEVFGYLFSGDTQGKCVFLFQGVSNSGKSMLIKMLLHCYERNQRLTMDLRSMGDKFALANFREVRINVCHDMAANALSTDVVHFIKTITGDEELTSDQKYKNAIHFTHRTRLVMATNYAIRTKDPHDYALLEARTVTPPFAYSVPREHWDHQLTDKLIAELPAIVYQALQAYHRLVRNQYVFSGEYPMNMITSSLCPERAASIDTLMYEFVHTHISPAPDAVVHLDDARECFNQLYGIETSAAQFSPLFKQLAMSQYGAVAAKVRREGYGNPISSLRHVKLTI